MKTAKRLLISANSIRIFEKKIDQILPKDLFSPKVTKTRKIELFVTNRNIYHAEPCFLF